MSTVSKTLKLLSFLKTTSPELGLSQFTKLSGYDKASTHRRLTELVNAGFLEQDPYTKTYHLGAAISRLALVREQSFPASESARRVLQRLYDEVQETVHVSVLQGVNGLSTLAHVDDKSHGNRVYIEPADVLPYHATASGIAVLAFSDRAFRDQVLGSNFECITDETETNPDILRLHVEDAQRTGFGRSDGAYEQDVHSIAAPVFGASGACDGAIAVALPKSRLTQDAEALFMHHLTAAAEDLSERWGGRVPIQVKEAWSAVGFSQ
jgi:DNA-binding IclR family transcriptional regulator